MLNSSAIQLRLQALADLATAGSTHALPVRPAQEPGDSHECIFVFRYLFWRDAGKIARGRFKSSDLLMGGSIGQYRPASIICEARGRNGTRRMDGMERSRDLSRDPQF